ncbi:site-specific integrase [Rosistilla oblonga]|uniref:site-specific integrase n=1 Tax=Rosistilla oblonga TaxID=2527990 RepID=UPI0011A814B3|nr:site-specific integrase [Rosistilla oblonga]
MNNVQHVSLHAMLDSYSAYITQRSAASPASAAKRTNVIRRLKEAHKDLPINAFGHGDILSMVDHWRSRPAAKTSGKPIARTTAAKHISELRNFLAWLHENPEASWSMPSNFRRLNTQPVRLDSDFRSKGQPS